jgi:hypothetical protein
MRRKQGRERKKNITKTCWKSIKFEDLTFEKEQKFRREYSEK